MPATQTTVRLYPTVDYIIPGVPAVVTDCDPVEAEILLGYQPPAFTTEPPTAPTPTPTPTEE